MSKTTKQTTKQVANPESKSAVKVNPRSKAKAHYYYAFTRVLAHPAREVINGKRTDGYLTYDPDMQDAPIFREKKPFEECYQDSTKGVSYSVALLLIKLGEKVTRKAWGGFGAFICKVESTTITAEQIKNEAAQIVGPYAKDKDVTIRTRIDMCTPNNEIICGWTPTTSDMFADDWVVVQ